uniref:Sulfotransferase n=1 Tax=Melopsittacus undulatus TaxID=13146 RepID=A0A8V5GA62_MELUD
MAIVNLVSIIEKISPESILFPIEVSYTPTLTSPETLEALKSFETWSDDMIIILVLLQNPKDTAVSYYCFYNNMLVMPSFASWDEYFAAFMKGKCNLSLEWNKYIDHERIMMISCKELKETLGMKKISSFFASSLCEEDFQRIAKKTSFQAMKEKSKEMHGKSGDILFWKAPELVGFGDCVKMCHSAKIKVLSHCFHVALFPCATPI